VPRSPSTTMWSQLRDISIRVDEDAERGTPLNVGECYGLVRMQANTFACILTNS